MVITEVSIIIIKLGVALKREVTKLRYNIMSTKIVESAKLRRKGNTMFRSQLLKYHSEKYCLWYTAIFGKSELILTLFILVAAVVLSRVPSLSRARILSVFRTTCSDRFSMKTPPTPSSLIRKLSRPVSYNSNSIHGIN